MTEEEMEGIELNAVTKGSVNDESSTLRSGISVAPLINVPPGKFYKKNKRTPLK